MERPAPTPDRPLVSIIIAAYNAGPYIAEAVRSALDQSYTEIELFVVNDGSTDDTRAILAGFHDPRMQVIDQPNGGIGRARNAGLDHVRGSFVCFLDADDVMPPNSVKARLDMLLADPTLTFADGTVLFHDRALKQVLRTWTPAFTGEPLQLLARFDRRCFFGNTWMIRWGPVRHCRFDTAVTHAEDMLFYLTMAEGRRYGHTTEPVLHYRVTGHSSMTRLEGLERSYHYLHQWLRARPALFDKPTLRRNRYLIRRMMSGAYLHAGRPGRAVLAWFR